MGSIELIMDKLATLESLSETKKQHKTIRVIVINRLQICDAIERSDQTIIRDIHGEHPCGIPGSIG